MTSTVTSARRTRLGAVTITFALAAACVMLVRPSAGLSNEQKGALKSSPAATMPAPGGPRHGDDRDDRDGPAQP